MYIYQCEGANRNPVSNTNKKSFEQKAEIALEIAAQRAKEVLQLAVKGEDVGTRGNGGAAVHAGIAAEVASQYAHLAAEKYFDDDDSKPVRDAEKLFMIADVYNHLVVEPPYVAAVYNAARLYRTAREQALETGDYKELDQARKQIARGTLDFLYVAHEVAPQNEEIKKALKYCQSVVRRYKDK